MTGSRFGSFFYSMSFPNIDENTVGTKATSSLLASLVSTNKNEKRKTKNEKRKTRNEKRKTKWKYLR